MKNKKYLKPAVAIALALSLAASPTYLGMASSEASAATKQVSAPVISGEVFADSSILSGSTTDKSAATVIVTFSNGNQRIVGVSNGKFSVNLPAGVLVAGGKISVKTANKNYEESLATDIIVKAASKSQPVTPVVPLTPITPATPVVPVTPVTPVKPVTPTTQASAPQIVGTVNTSSTILSGVTTDKSAVTVIVAFSNGDMRIVGVQNGRFSVNLPASVLVAGGKISVKTANKNYEESLATDIIIQAAK
ncbi:outer membrane autotransporter barrel domain-containing protein [Listeria grandensis FSL F6-0971]|uniref:Outer membrane autotransporter barrel domain-containing protein n=1 Tax=Listeria grandensis FSL F6-0971 TaxID=1265819 RepID=W7BDD3_9LIST|nr:hypothetical protein [Listeria grandensis]EUJ23922.1 outer membrane autotransporter barrel domain-containing protein [Listeria grandensis FSL F6-0971]